MCTTFVNIGFIIIHVYFVISTDTPQKQQRDDKNKDTSKSSIISTSDMQLLVDKLQLERHWSSTRCNYYSVWRTFNKFYLCLDIKPKTWEDRLTLFIRYLIKNHLKSTSIRSSAIKAVLIEDGVKINPDSYLISALTKAYRYKNDTIGTRMLIRKPLLESL